MRLRIIHVRSDHRPGLPIRRSLAGAEVVDVVAARLVRHVEHEEAAVFVVDVDLRSPEAVLAVRAGLARSPAVPTVFVVDRGQRADETQALALGADRVVTRPVDAMTLELAIRAVLAPKILAAIDSMGAGEPEEVPAAISAAARAAGEMLDGFRAGRAPTASEVAGWSRNVTDEVDAAGLDAWMADARTRHTGVQQHSLMVAGLASRFGADLGLSGSERNVLTAAALLHDVGAGRLPPELYDRLDRLSEAEFSIVRKHPQLGAEHLSAAGLDPRVVAAVRHHHEFLDGSGFPDGLSGAAIPSVARLITICELFCGFIAQRAYRLPTAPEAAYRKLEQLAEAGKLDPALVAAFRATAAAISATRVSMVPDRAGGPGAYTRAVS